MFQAVDAHCDTLLKVLDEGFSFSDDGAAAVNARSLRRGGVVLQFFAAYIGEAYKPYGSLRRALELIEAYHRMVDGHRRFLFPIRWKEELAEVEKRCGALLAIEGGEALVGSLSLLDIFFRLGVRSIGLTWNQRNLLADGSWEERSRGGLTRFGRQVVERMETLGMVVDAAHIAPAGFWDLCAICRRPWLVSHTCCRSLQDHPRNIDNRQIAALAKRRGVMGITFYPEFLGESRGDMEGVADHIEQACQVGGGVEHVGIGSDFDGADRSARGLTEAGCLPRLWEALGRRGFSDDQIRAVAGGNLMRLLAQSLPERPCEIPE
ncbi:renal dipeptidase family protein, putative [Heliomicrobium modesticaldum Ice1]|uniref:Renal dipeptidase family protein, putative n=1 Tax=Heliobacterium modesticaldum (strain ATCC 51547 / Ice1) TaxID=498761 RepID=B0TIJ2_HELMI|nr:dipeptidase [Heliomicrobium modesticaldum]ABZ84933.1 renal dipeptidase family protein, putative [Heliomicrobium modesticaldum Ice1]